MGCQKGTPYHGSSVCETDGASLGSSPMDSLDYVYLISLSYKLCICVCNVIYYDAMYICIWCVYCVCVFIYIYIHTYIHINMFRKPLYIYICIYYSCIYIYIYTYTCVYKHFPKTGAKLLVPKRIILTGSIEFCNPA